jgi:putative ABC transport system substrate-binding protein
LLALLTQLAPGVKRAAMIFNPDTAPGGGKYYLPEFEAAARSFKVAPIAAPVRGDAEIETVITSLGHEPRGCLVVMPDSFMNAHRSQIIPLAARNNVPAVYSETYFVRDGGLISYGPDQADIFRRVAPYVDRILRGAKPAELPVQVPTKFEMALNVKTAKALDLEIPPTLLALANEVIE